MRKKLSMPELLRENEHLKEQLLIVAYELRRRSITDRNIRRLMKLMRNLSAQFNRDEFSVAFVPSLKTGKQILKETLERVSA